MAIKSLQLICQSQDNHICEKAYENTVMDFITIISSITGRIFSQAQHFNYNVQLINY
jgi:hypothetical protein